MWISQDEALALVNANHEMRNSQVRATMDSCVYNLNMAEQNLLFIRY